MIVPARARSPDFLRVQGASQRFEGFIRDLCALGKVREVARHAEPRASQSAASSPKALAPKAPIHPFCRCRLRSRRGLRARDAREREGAERAFLREMGVRDAARAMGGRSRLQRVLNGESALSAWNRGQPKAYRVQTLGESLRAAATLRRAYVEARAGGRHSGWYADQRSNGDRQIRKGIRSIKRQIADHLAWIENPTLKVEDWASKDERYRRKLLRRWQGDIARQREQVEILEGILLERSHGDG